MSNRTLIIAEAGVNHNGDFELAKQLIEVAADAGADIVKFQTFSAKRLTTKFAAQAEYQARNFSESQYAMLKRLELSESVHDALIEHCEKVGIKFLSTGFDIQDLDFLIERGIDLIKIPSGEITNLPYLRHVGSLGLPAILSTGMATLGEIESALVALQAAGLSRSQITVLHCNTEYPTPIADVNLKAMVNIGNAFNVKVGYSDHTLGIEIAIAATALGACVIEKHFTLNRKLPGPDHSASLEPDELKAMVTAVRNIEAALGDGVKSPTPSELKNKPVARKSLVASVAIRAGEKFSCENVSAKRPGTGISPIL